MHVHTSEVVISQCNSIANNEMFIEVRVSRAMFIEVRVSNRSRLL